MSAPTVRISEHSRECLKQLAEQSGQTMMNVLDQAIDAYRRKLLLEQINAGYAELRSDTTAWAEHVAERQGWDTALADGLDTGEHWAEDGRETEPHP